jgi:hypothetical protein
MSGSIDAAGGGTNKKDFEKEFSRILRYNEFIF